MLDLLLFAGAVLGHFALTVRSHNWFYGSPWHRRIIDVFQLLHGLILLAGPVVFWLVAGGFNLRSLFDPFPDLFWGRPLAGYVAVCWLVGFVVFPAVTAARLMRRCPALVEERSHVVDVAAQLGHKPAGTGKHRLACLLPFNEVFQVDLTEKTLVLPDLRPELDGLTILHLSDLHLCGAPGREFHEAALDLALAWKPDLIALTGDYVDDLVHHAWMEPVLGRLQAREGVLAILGNHDLWFEPERVRDRLREMGFRVLSHSWQMIEVRGVPLIVVGHEGPWIRPAPDLRDAPEGVFRLCLSHTPDNMAWARKQGIDLMLSGHVHGGQVRLPVIGSIVAPSRLGRRYDCGVFQEGKTVLHVSRGLAGEHPLRFLCRPEMTLLRLKGERGA